MTAASPNIPPQQPIEPEEDRPHKPADDREEVYFQGSPMLRGEIGRLFSFSLAAIALLAIPITWYVLAKEGSGPPWWVALVFVVLALIVACVPIILTKAISYRVSNYRIDIERGWLSKNIDTLELWHVEDIQFHQSLTDRLLGVGTITIISHDDTTPQLQLKSLPRPRPLFETLKQRVIAVKRQRGVIKMDMGT